MGCVNPVTVTIETEFEIYIYYCDNCLKSKLILNAIKANKKTINDYHKITLIKFKESDCSKSHDVIYCSDPPNQCKLNKEYFNGITLNYINFNNIDVTEPINYEVNQAFIHAYGNDPLRFNTNMAYIILFSKGDTKKDIEQLFWSNEETFKKKITAYITS